MANYRLAVLTSHPVQYQAPLFRKLASSPDIELMVYFCSDAGLSGRVDPGFNIPLTWDLPLLDGYPHRFLFNFSRRSMPSAERFFSCFNPGIVSEILRGHYDAIFIHGYSLATNWLAFGAASLCGLPMLLHGETVLSNDRADFFSSFKKGALSQLFKQITAFLFIGTRSREFYESFGISRERLFFCPYSVDNQFFMGLDQQANGERVRNELGIASEKPVILYVAKLTPRKRPLDCLKALIGIGDKAALVMVGDGELRGELAQYAAANKLGDVFFAGFKNQKQLADFYSLADLFVLPSSFEPWGVVINEAMCFSLPIVTTDGVASAVDLVRPEENGLIYPAGDVNALSACLNRLLVSSTERKRMGGQSRQIISNWNYGRCVEGILGALNYAKWRKRKN